MIKLSTIKPNPNNPRLVKDDNFFKLVESIKTFGEKMMPLRPMVIDEKRILLGGNMRYKALKELNYKEVPKSWVKEAKDLSEDEKREFIIKDNVGFGLWDWDILANEWNNEDLEAWGLDIPEFESDLELEAKDDNYEEPEFLKVDVIEGDLIEFICNDGRTHRLICGDSTCSDTVDKLNNLGLIGCIVTDPPYGIGIDGQKLSISKNPKHNRKKHEFKGWDKSRPSYELFVSITSLDKPTIIFGGNYFADLLPPSRGWIYWDKGQNGLTMSDGELAWTNIDKVLRSIICNRANLGKTIHPTQKPVKVIEFCIKYTETKGTVLDLFLGSGTTMVAAHQLNRTCYGMELDPKYCQLIIDRMQKLDSSLEVKINGKEYESKPLPI